MIRWFAYFREQGKLPYFRLVVALSLSDAELMGNELATREGEEFLGAIVAPQAHQLVKAT